MTTTPPSKLVCPELVKQVIAAMVPMRLRRMRAATSPGVLTPKYLLARPVMISLLSTVSLRGHVCKMRTSLSSVAPAAFSRSEIPELMRPSNELVSSLQMKEDAYRTRFDMADG